MKNLKSIFIKCLLLANLTAFSQVDSLYFGLTPPSATPAIFAPGHVTLNSQNVEKLTVSQDGSEIYWNASPIDQWRTPKIKYSYYDTVNKTWSAPEILFEDYFANPIITPDNKLLTIFNNNLYLSERSARTWSQPQIIDSTVFANYEIGNIAITNDTVLCFIDLSSTNHTLYLSEFRNGHFRTPEPLPFPVNLKQYKINNPFLAKDGSYILYSIHDFPGGEGASDLFITFNRGSHWTYPKSVGKHINSSTHDYGVYVSPDERYLFFTRWEFDNTVNMYWVSAQGLFENLQNSNFTPYVSNPIEDQSIMVDNSFEYTVTDTTFMDDDGVETLSFSATLKNGDNLPDLLTFDAETKSFSGMLTQAGTYEIKVTATDTEFESASSIFKLTVNQTAGSNEIIANENLSIHFNPDKKVISLNSDLSIKINEFEITDLNGRVIKQGKLYSNAIELSGLSLGVYIIKLKTNNGDLKQKIMIR